MPEVTAEDMLFTHAQIVNAVLTWANFNGFSGESCGDACKATANVLAGAGWFCPCGHYNVQSWNHHQIPHEEPTYGPTRGTICAAIVDGRRQQTLEE